MWPRALSSTRLPAPRSPLARRKKKEKPLSRPAPDGLRRRHRRLRPSAANAAAPPAPRARASPGLKKEAHPASGSSLPAPPHQTLGQSPPMDDDDLATPTHAITGSTSGEWDVAWKSSLGTEEESAPPLPSHDPSNDDGGSHNDPRRRRSPPPLRQHQSPPPLLQHRAPPPSCVCQVDRGRGGQAGGSGSRQGARASLPPIRLVSSSVLLCCQILRSCRTSISLPPCEECHQAIATTKAAQTTTSLEGL